MVYAWFDIFWQWKLPSLFMLVTDWVTHKLQHLIFFLLFFFDRFIGAPELVAPPRCCIWAVCFSTACLAIESNASATFRPECALVKYKGILCSLANASAYSFVTCLRSSSSHLVATIILSTSSLACCSIWPSHTCMLLKVAIQVVSKARIMPLAPL